MAILSNINGKFRVDSAGAVYFGTSAGTNLQVLQSVGTTGSPAWVNVVDIIGGPYLPLTGGDLAGDGNLLVGGTLAVNGVTTLNANVLMGNTVTNPASGFADQTGIGLKYSTTVPELQVSSDSTAMQLGRTTTGGDGQIMAMRYGSNTIHSFNTNAVSIGTSATFSGNVFARRGSFGTASNFSFDLYVNGDAYINDALTVDDNATFAGDVTINGIGTWNTPSGGVAFNVDAFTDGFGVIRFRTNGNASKWDLGMNSSNHFYIGNNGVNTALEIEEVSSNATFTGGITAIAATINGQLNVTGTNSNNIIAPQVTTQFDTSSFMRFHPNATTNATGYTNIFFGTSVNNNYGIAIGGVKTGTGDDPPTGANPNSPAFSIRILDDSIIGVEALRISHLKNSTFYGNVSMPTGNSTGKFAVMSTSVHPSFDFYNNGTSYFNGATTVDAAFTQSGGAASSFSGNLGIGGAPGQNLDVQKPGARFRLIDGTNQLNMGLWDGTNYRFEGDANRPMFFTSYQGNIVFGISGGTTMTVNSGGVGIGATPTTTGMAGNIKVLQIGQRGVFSAYTSSGNVYMSCNVRVLSNGNNVAITSGVAGQYRIADDQHVWYSAANVNAGAVQNLVLTAKIDNAGTFTVKGDVVAYGSPSDISLKENIKPISNSLDKVKKLQGVTFDWIQKKDQILDIKEDIGFIAQDVKKVIPELVRKNEDGLLSMRHQGIIPILVEAIKELEARVKELENK